MNPAPPFKLVNCLSQGFAVAGPAEHPEDELEMLQWGMARDKAVGLRDRLNREAQHISDGLRPPLHRRD